MRMIPAIILAIALSITACSTGGDDYNANVPTNAPPIISRVEPNSGVPGDEITIFGFGFSVAFPDNIIVVGGAATSATSYNLLADPTSSEIESITFNVPAEAVKGEGAVFVEVYDNVSNTDVSFTVL